MSDISEIAKYDFNYITQAEEPQIRHKSSFALFFPLEVLQIACLVLANFKQIVRQALWTRKIGHIYEIMGGRHVPIVVFPAHDDG
ncbi:hypothetical protein CEXT_118011, partial [Caerostris extrusa]